MKAMATVYKVEIVSHWSNYTKAELQKRVTDTFGKSERGKGNEIQVIVKERS